jgi:fatty acid synthase
LVTGSVKFLVNIFDGSGKFEVCEGGAVVVTGRIYAPEDVEKEQLDLPVPAQPADSQLLPLKTPDIYKDLRLRGYDYGGIFRGISESDNRGTLLLTSHKAFACCLTVVFKKF